MELVMSTPSGQVPPSPGMSRTFWAAMLPLPVAMVLMSMVPMTTSWVPPSAPVVFGVSGQLWELVTKICVLPQALPEPRPDEVQVTV
jgi:hypothetical protein